MFEIKALQKKIDTWDFTPKLLWTNIPLAIAFLSRFIEHTKSENPTNVPTENLHHPTADAPATPAHLLPSDPHHAPAPTVGAEVARPADGPALVV